MIVLNSVADLLEGPGTDINMSISEQQSSQEFDAGGFGSVTRGQLSAMLLNNEASASALQLPLVSPEVINLSRISPNDDSQEGLYGGGGIGINPRLVWSI